MKVITLTLNPAFDVHCTGENFIPFAENLFKVTSRDAGGKGINVSKALSSFGVKTENILLIGKDNGDEFLNMLEAENISHKEIFINGAIRENITLHSGNKETRISFEGFRADEKVFLKLKEMILQCMGENTVIVMSGRLPLGISSSLVTEFLSELKDKGAKIVVDSKSFNKEDILKIKPFLIKPNEEEIFEYTNISDLEYSSVKNAAEELKNMGIANVLVSLGEKGALLCADEGIFFGNAPKIKMISTIGAGDSMVAGFIAAISKGLSNEEILKTAIASGSAACEKEGTNVPGKEDVDRLISEITIIKG